jgi:flagellin-like hook-associated protein FlgL
MNGYYHFAVTSAASRGEVRIELPNPFPAGNNDSILSIDLDLLDAGGNPIKLSNISVERFTGAENSREVGDLLVQEIIHQLAVRNLGRLYSVENTNGVITVTANQSGTTLIGPAPGTPGMTGVVNTRDNMTTPPVVTAEQGNNAQVTVNLPDNTQRGPLEATKDGFVFLNTIMNVGGADHEANISMRIVNPMEEGLVAGINVWEGNRLTLQIGANTGTDQTIQIAVQRVSASGLGVENLQVDNHRNSQMAIDRIESAIQKVSLQRSGLGAVQNRLEHTVANLDTVGENLQGAESRIRDLDMAKEMMAFTKNNILTQAATAMLAQANQSPQSVLQLLQ